MRRSLFWPLLAFLLVASATAIVFWLKTPPAAARLLPQCDAIIYVDVKPLRTITHFDRSPVHRAPEYQAFVDATGIVPERDLDAVALAMHRMDDPHGPNGPVAYSEVFKGRFDAGKLEHYLASIAAARESYAGKTIFSIPVGEVSGPGGRRLRVAVLDQSKVVASNAPTPEQIHAMLDHGRTGPSLLAGYGDVPTFASAWGIGRLALPFAEEGRLSVAGLRLPVRDDAEFVASLRYTGDAVKLRVEELAGNDQNATKTTQELSPLLSLTQTLVQNQVSGLSSPLMGAIRSIAIVAKGDRVVLTGNLPLQLLQEIAATQTVQAPR